MFYPKLKWQSLSGSNSVKKKTNKKNKLKDQ